MCVCVCGHTCGVGAGGGGKEGSWEERGKAKESDSR